MYINPPIYDGAGVVTTETYWILFETSTNYKLAIIGEMILNNVECE